MFQSNPDMPWQALREAVKKNKKMVITKNQFYRTKRKVEDLIEGNHKEQYKLI